MRNRVLELVQWQVSKKFRCQIPQNVVVRIFPNLPHSDWNRIVFVTHIKNRTSFINPDIVSTIFYFLLFFIFILFLFLFLFLFFIFVFIFIFIFLLFLFYYFLFLFYAWKWAVKLCKILQLEGSVTFKIQIVLV